MSIQKRKTRKKVEKIVPLNVSRQEIRVFLSSKKELLDRLREYDRKT